MPGNGWLSEEYIRERLLIASKLSRKFSLEDFKLLFFVPIEDERVCEIAK